ncbi:hypothetical protein C349_03549 [Cryptococcus neoformans var. grubii Br795]|nr:hypothetical protein C368_03575 [Cryptococcus neoformans var. grubii 125.91]OXG41512.1 hypothetical protein C359_02918 [Cryptococcus neoformans var. grubii Bt120]OXG50083.1 hypothetical protein C355_03047 [Cryptococcus neoformans var. grubii Th84]OXG80908.1 hypothetical protein C350_03399 [Cryptococcus neoformans var. grubii MW-RSA36]OXG82240.1 hypothetical protein C349_03549 [Cryptococcus neoformans var. grubii Br795]OXH31160.1 hypothetical protein J009_03439 [Cryptococcus neoformans var. 
MPLLSSLLALLPPQHPVTPFDYNLGFINAFLTTVILSLPHHGPWRLFRIAIAAPLISTIWGYLMFIPVTESNYDHWGIPILLLSFIFRTYELLVFFPAEEHTHRFIPRLNPRPPPNVSALKPPSSSNDTQPLVPERVPAPFTLAKFYWATSLWWSWRGVGWNYCCPLPSSSRREPYTKGSPRRAYFFSRLTFIAAAWLFYDFMRSLMNLTSARAFFHPNPTLTYADLTLGQKAIYSIMVVTRTWYGLNLPHVLAALLCVGIGGLMGWEGEMWSPWGWPPLFGNFTELWRYPGLSTMWSRTWQGFNRRWLYVFGWIGISEKVLHLTHTGLSSHPSVPPDSSSSANTPSPSGRVSPNHPIPTTPTQLPSKRMTPMLMFQNLVKSTIVFGLSGLQHDCGTLVLLMKTHPGKIRYFKDILILTPFFVIQPLALAGEAMVKTTWRGWKSRSHPTWKLGKQPGWLTFVERLLGFIWTWVWLGWSAGWFVRGTTEAGAYWMQEGETYPSLVGGLVWNKWVH